MLGRVAFALREMWVSLLCSCDENVCLVDFGRKELKIQLGTNDFFGVPFPLVMADRFFHVYGDLQGKMTLDVFRWDDDNSTFALRGC
jgi:hypothetical protein